MGICGRNHGLVERLALVTNVELDLVVRVCLLDKDIGTQQEEIIMATKAGIKLPECATIVRRMLCLEIYCEVES